MPTRFNLRLRAFHQFISGSSGRSMPASSGWCSRSLLAPLLLVLAALACQVHAEDTTSACKAAQAQPGESAGAAVQRMLDAVPACQKDAVFLATLGQLLNSQGRYFEAADHLERALMLEPDLKDAQLSYAIALTGTGDVLAAAQLLDTLLADPGLPAYLRPIIAWQKAALVGVVEPIGWQSRFAVATRVGYDSNLLGAPNLGSLVLTPPGPALVLPLDGSYLAQGGAYVRADAWLDMYRTTSDGALWYAAAFARQLYSPAVRSAGLSQLDVLLERSHYTRSDGWGSPDAADGQEPEVSTTFIGSYFNVSATGLHSEGGTRYSAQGISGGVGGTWRITGGAICQGRAGPELQARTYSSNPVLSGRYSGLGIFWSCEKPSGLQWLVGLRVGRDFANNDARPGGDQNQGSLRVTGFLPMATFGQIPNSWLADWQRSGLLLDIEQSQRRDSFGYSPILESGRIRTISRRATRLEYQHATSSSVQWFLGGEWVAQVSNLQLFRATSWGAYSGVRLSW